MRFATAADVGGAVAAISGATEHLREQGWMAVGAMGLTGPSGRVGVLSAHDSLSQMLDRRSAVATDPAMVKLMSDTAEAFVPGSGTDYILRVVHGAVEEGEGGGDLLAFRAVIAKPNELAPLVATAVQIAEHIESVHGHRATVSTSVGADQEGILFVTRHESGDHMEALGDALAADELMGKLVAKGTEHSAGGMARIIRMFR